MICFLFCSVNIPPAAQDYPASTYPTGYVQQPQVGTLVEHPHADAHTCVHTRKCAHANTAPTHY